MPESSGPIRSSPTDQMALALAAYAAYVVNASQFLWKLRMARLDGEARA